MAGIVLGPGSRARRHFTLELGRGRCCAGHCAKERVPFFLGASSSCSTAGESGPARQRVCVPPRATSLFPGPFPGLRRSRPGQDPATWATKGREPAPPKKPEPFIFPIVLVLSFRPRPLSYERWTRDVSLDSDRARSAQAGCDPRHEPLFPAREPGAGSPGPGMEDVSGRPPAPAERPAFPQKRGPALWRSLVFSHRLLLSTAWPPRCVPGPRQRGRDAWAG